MQKQSQYRNPDRSDSAGAAQNGGTPITWLHRVPRLALLSSFALLLGFAGSDAFSAEVLKVRVEPETKYQVIDGFGASDAWQCQFVGKNWPLAKREQIADLLFSRELDGQGNPKGIGLSLWRFYISSGTAEQGETSDIANPWRRGECFQKPDGSYDWSKQAGQQWFLKAARQRGVEKFLAFPNAAPVHLSRNGKGYAPKGLTSMNVRPGKLEQYSTFLVDVIEHFQKQGLPFDYLSPFNEPQNPWDEAGQEGTPALNIELYALVRYLSKDLSHRKLTTQLVLGEGASIGHIVKVMDDDGRDNQAQFFFNPESPFYVGALTNVALLISGHNYFSVWPLDKQVEYRHLLHGGLGAINPRLGFWMSEYCVLEPKNEEVGEGAGRDLGMKTALYIARIIHNDLAIANARSWQWWTAISQVDFKDGLIYLDDGSAGATGRMGPETASLMQDGAVRESKLLWAFGNYSRFVRPGMVRVKAGVEPKQSTANGVLVSAYKNGEGRLVVVLVNLSTEQQKCDLGLPKEVEVYTTSETDNLRKSRQQGSSVTLPPRSILTCVTK